MQDLKKRYGDWAVVAGAAGGIGEAFAQGLARRGVNLVMIDNDGEGLHTTAGRLRDAFGVEAVTLGLDLANEGAVRSIMEEADKVGCRFLVYVAAYSKVQRFTDNTPGDLDAYVDVNVRTPLHLFHAFAGRLKPDGPVAMIIMSSLGSLWGTRFLVPYGATKAFDLVLAEALHYELKPMGVDVMACIAGATATPTYLASQPKYGLIRPPLQRPAQVAESALKNIGKKAVHISGWQNRMTYFLMSRVFSRSGAARMFNRTVSGMYGDRLGA